MSTERAPRDQPRSISDRILGATFDVKNGEGNNALILLLAIFVLLVSYYVLKTVREPLIEASASQMPTWMRALLDGEGAQLKAVAAAFQAVVLIGFVPAYSWVAARMTRIRLIAGVGIFFIACIELFFVMRLLSVPMLGFYYFIWVGIFSVAMVAQFWSFGNDVYTEDQGKRLFPIIGIGATAGGPVGAKIAGYLYDYLAPEEGARLDGFQRWVVESGTDPSFILLQVPALLLIVFTLLMVWVAVRVRGQTAARGRAGASAEAPDNTPGGFTLLLKSPYLRLIAATILLLNVVNTAGELLLSDVVFQTANALEASGEIPAKDPWIGAFYGDFYLYGNLLALALQTFAVSRIVKHVGLKGVLFALPIVALGTYGLFAAGVGLAVLRWAKTAENAADYSIMNTGKAMVWLPTSRGAKYKGKQAVDTFVVRVGDMIAAGVFLLGTAALGWGLEALAVVNLGFVILWLVATYFLVKRHDGLAASPDDDIATRGVSPASEDASDAPDRSTKSSGPSRETPAVKSGSAKSKPSGPKKSKTKKKPRRR